MATFKILKSFRHLEDYLQEGIFAEIREDLVAGLVKEGWIADPKASVAVSAKK